MEGIVTLWIHDAIKEIEDDYRELEIMQSRHPRNLWDLYRSEMLKFDILPCLRTKIKKHKNELYAMLCTCKSAYIINGALKNNL